MALITNHKRLFSLALIISLLCFFNTANGLAPDTETNTLAPSRDQSITSVELVNQLLKRHYLGIRLDDNLSSRFFNAYLANLDTNRNILLASDVKAFEQYRFSLDDTLKRGDLSPGYNIFNRYRDRLIQRLENVLATLPKTIENLDFTKEESMMIDRKEQAWPKNSIEADNLWRKRIKTAVLNLKLTGKAPEKITELLEKRFDNQLTRVKQLNSEDVFQLYLNSYTQLYDPHTNYLSPRSSENFNINMSLKLQGIGAVLQREDEYTKVVRLVHSGPADKQGDLSPSDRIISVGQGKEGELVDVIGWRLDEVVQLIRGEKNTVVRLKVIPVEAKTDDQTAIVEIVRDTVKLEEQSAQSSIIEVLNEQQQLIKIGVIDVPAFYIDFDALRRRDPNYKSTTRDVSKLLEELRTENVSGIIVDLRDNGGGSLKEANELTGLFIDYGPTVQIRHASERIFREQKMTSSPYYDGPLLVLINRLSASASEIFAAAMQDYQRAIVVGGQTFGKGTVQSLTPLRQGQLKLTESKFYRISGDSTQHRGVVPDIAFPPLYDKERVGESALEDALAWDQINAVRHRRYYEVPNILPTLTQKHESRINKDPDFQFLLEQMAYSIGRGNTNVLTLNEKKRISEDNEEKSKRLTIENTRRVAKGLEPLDKLDGDVDAEDKVADTSDKASEAHKNDKTGDTKEDEEKDDDGDIFLTEAGQILADAINLFSKHIASNEQR